MHKLDFGNIALNTSLGIGGVDIEVARKVSENNVGLGNLQDGTLEGYLGANISYLALDIGANLSISFVPMCGKLSIGANTITITLSMDGLSMVNHGIDQEQ